jgi:hypothetical protein
MSGGRTTEVCAQVLNVINHLCKYIHLHIATMASNIMPDMVSVI